MQQKRLVLSFTIEIIEDIASTIKTDNILAELLKVKEKLAIDFDSTANTIRDLVYLLFENHPATPENFYYQIIQKIFQCIDENNPEGIKALFEIGKQYIQGGIDINEEHFPHNTFLYKAIGKGKLGIVELLLTLGASPNKYSSMRTSPFSHAVGNGYLAMVILLVNHGLTPKTLNGEPEEGFSPLYQATRRGRLDMVQVLVAAGANLNPVRNGLGRGETFNFTCALRVALNSNKLDIAKYLFEIIKKDINLFTNCLNIFLKYAPLEFLEQYLEDASIPIKQKLATLIITRIDREKPTEIVASGEILLRYLLSETSDSEKRLTVIQKLIKQLMRLDYLDSRTEQETCFKDKPLFEEFAKGNDPINVLARELLSSMNDSMKQNVFHAGLRVLSQFTSNSNLPFVVGIKVIEDLTEKLTHLKQSSQLLPDESVVEEIIDRHFEGTKSQRKTVMDSTDNPAVVRFRALVGSKIFTDLVPVRTIPITDANYYAEIVNLIVNTLEEVGMLNDKWNTAKAMDLLNSTKASHSRYYMKNYQAQKSSAVSITKTQEVYTSNFEVPEHYIPVINYKDKNNWCYTVLCRGFLQPETQVGGIVEFNVPDTTMQQVLPLLIDELFTYDTYNSCDSNVDREIKYRLFKHLYNVEKILGVRGIFSLKSHYKPYKNPTCFASNVKPLLPILLQILSQQPQCPEKLGLFNEKIKQHILVEMKKANVSIPIEELLQKTSEGKVFSQEQIAYKLITLLHRWYEINRYVPTSKIEVEAKTRSVNHVLEHTSVRFNFRAEGNYTSQSGISLQGSNRTYGP